jgi:hypothetical protein
LTRCRARNRSGSRCRLHVKDPLTGFCFRHADYADSASEDPDLSTELFPDLPEDKLPDLTTADHINELLSRIVVLLAQGRISARRAAVMTFGGSLLLRSVVVMDRASSEELPRITFDLPRSSASSCDEADPASVGFSSRPQT